MHRPLRTTPFCSDREMASAVVPLSLDLNYPSGNARLRLMIATAPERGVKTQGSASPLLQRIFFDITISDITIGFHKHLPQFRAPKPITKLTIKTMGTAKKTILITAAYVIAIMPKPNAAAKSRNTELNMWDSPLSRFPSKLGASSQRTYVNGLEYGCE